MKRVFQLLDSSCEEEGEEEEEAGLGAPKQTEGLCIVLSVSVLHPVRGADHTAALTPSGTLQARQRTDLRSPLSPVRVAPLLPPVAGLREDNKAA